MEITDTGILCSGIKEGKLGLALAKCSGNVAGLFTKNSIKAAPVRICEENIADGKIEGLIVNSGNANAFTGEKGLEDAMEMCKIAAELLKCNTKDIAIASTGVIGRKLDMEWIRKKAVEVYQDLGNSKEHAEKFGRAIMTTDKFLKKAYSEKAKISAVAKGAGMIAPNLATMLCFIFTTAKFDSGELYEMLKMAAENSFNRLTIDGDTSTNDTVLLISTCKDKVDRDTFSEELTKVCRSLAYQMARDGEGATRVFTVRVTGAEDDEIAARIAKAVASSLLVKTAIFGRDPNWGRIVAAVGYTANVDEKISISFSAKSEVRLVDRGVILENEEKARKLMEENEEFEIVIDLHRGAGEGFAIGCDLSYDYVKLNSAYTT